MLLAIDVVFAAKFRLQQSEQMCIQEELPEGAIFQGRYGADQMQLQPAISIRISFGEETVFEDELGALRTFSMTAERGGIYRLCFTAIEVSSNPALTRELQYEQVYTEILSQDEKLSAAQTVQRLARETVLDLQHGKKRITQLSGLAAGLRTRVTVIGALAILVTCGIIAAQNAWLTAEVKRRL